MYNLIYHKYNGNNIIGIWKNDNSSKNEKIIVVCAHYDSRDKVCPLITFTNFKLQ